MDTKAGSNIKQIKFTELYNDFPDNYDSYDFPDDGKIDMTIGPFDNYIGYIFYPNNCVEMVNETNGQLIFINLDTKMYQIYKVSNKTNRSELMPINFKNKLESELYKYAKG